MVEETVKQQKVLNQPAGHVENGEDILTAVIRETREETAWGFEPQASTGVYRWILPDNGETYFRHCFSGRIFDHQVGQPLDEGIIQAAWYSRDELLAKQARLRSPLVLKCIDDYLAGHRFPLQLYQDVV